eukprot:1160992-Pelagomonas_calceolata.AAC.7
MPLPHGPRATYPTCTHACRVAYLDPGRCGSGLCTALASWIYAQPAHISSEGNALTDVLPCLCSGLGGGGIQPCRHPVADFVSTAGHLHGQALGAGDCVGKMRTSVLEFGFQPPWEGHAAGVDSTLPL